MNLKSVLMCLAALCLVPLTASAQLDVTAATTAVTAVGDDLVAIGGAIIGLAAVALGIRWVKATFF